MLCWFSASQNIFILFVGRPAFEKSYLMLHLLEKPREGWHSGFFRGRLAWDKQCCYAAQWLWSWWLLGMPLVATGDYAPRWLLSSVSLWKGEGSSWDSDTRDFFCSVSLFQKHGVLHSFSVIRFQSIIPGSPGSLCEESIAGSWLDLYRANRGHTLLWS